MHHKTVCSSLAGEILMKKILIALGLLVSFTGCDLQDLSPLIVSVQYNENPEFTIDHPEGPPLLSTVRIQANTDQITVEKVKVNRGQCPINYWIHSNPNLKFGQELTGVLRCDANQVLEVDVITDQGDFTFNF